MSNVRTIIAQLSHLGSEMLAACCTRPQYVVRSNWELGRSRVPGREEVMAASDCAGQLQPRRLANACYVRLLEERVTHVR